ncbi:nuclear transport factor 2 family protein [Streptomyces sp. S3(2020)]|uniref:nuclear transport factor 2 family protein n=1 Tax=Streptomyces sp. S3(2020) TaxID=2732044 RepID=UPI0014880782|nr:nuclear transport factor 2 family protein [Streptomyces sp. S3(2020)]NNN37847.1 nuclear transport factor 2 family protein [Streptomyces sp. S3(2020)]
MPEPQHPPLRTPREVLARFYRAMVDKSADDLADLYALDAVHEFPFAVPGFPPRYEGREAVRAGYRVVWGGSPVRVDEIRKVAAYETVEPGVIVAEHVVVGSLPHRSTPPRRTAITVPGLLVLHVHDGLITRARDYMDGSGVAAARE